MAATSTGTGLPIRTTLRWVASLDLSASVTNPRRDLRNGYLVAEVLARLYPVRGAGAGAKKGRAGGVLRCP